MVLAINIPHGNDFTALKPLIPVIISYIISFIYIGIYWNNHHHMMHTVNHVNGAILWANLHLLFWLSLVPFATGWIGENNFAPIPMALYGVILLMAALSYTILQIQIIRSQGKNSLLFQAVGNDIKGKMSLIFYSVAIALNFISHWISGGLYLLVTIIWLIPDKRIEIIFKSEAISKHK